MIEVVTQDRHTEEELTMCEHFRKLHQALISPKISATTLIILPGHHSHATGQDCFVSSK